MAGLTDVVSGVQNFVTALSGASRQLTGSFTNISGQITNLSSLVTIVASNSSAIAAIQAAYVTTIAGNSSAFTLASTTGITNSSNNIQLLRGSTSQYGAIKVDGTTVTASAGVISAVATVISLTSITNSLAADVALNNTSSYFDGPSVAQGSSGTWFASGTVTISDTAAANCVAKLWDGTTVIADTETSVVAGGFESVSLSGALASPAGNLRISVRDLATVNGKILFNQGGSSRSSTITAIRIV